MTDSWTPTHDRQHAPFEQGNNYALRHGARSERRVSVVAQQILEGLLENPETPRYLGEDSSYGPALTAWATAEARVSLINAYLDEQGLEKAFSGKGWMLEASRKWSVTAANLRTRLGLDPVSRAKILRDLSAARYLSGPSPFEAALDERARARELEGGVDGS